MSTQEQPLLGRRGMPLAAAGAAAAPLRPRRYAQWERRPRALDVQEAPAALPAFDDAPGADDFDRDGDARRSAHEAHRNEQEPSPRPGKAGLPAQAAAPAPVLPSMPRDVVTAAQAVSPSLPRDETTAVPVPPAIRSATATPAIPAPQRVLRTETVTRTVVKRVPGESTPAVVPTSRPTAVPSEMRAERQPFGGAITSPAQAAHSTASTDPAPQTAAALVQRIERLVLSPTTAPPAPSADLQDAAQPRGAAPTPAPPTAASRHAFGRATAEPQPAAPKAVSLDLLRGTAESPTLSIGSLHVVVKPPVLPQIPGTAPAAAQTGQPPPPAAAAPARPARGTYRNPWFAARRVE